MMYTLCERWARPRAPDRLAAEPLRPRSRRSCRVGWLEEDFPLPPPFATMIMRANPKAMSAAGASRRSELRGVVSIATADGIPRPRARSRLRNGYCAPLAVVHGMQHLGSQRPTRARNLAQ